MNELIGGIFLLAVTAVGGFAAGARLGWLRLLCLAPLSYYKQQPPLRRGLGSVGMRSCLVALPAPYRNRDTAQ